MEPSLWAAGDQGLDFTDNTVGLIPTTGPKQERLVRKYAPLAPVLRELILRPDTPLDADVKTRIAAHLDSAAAGSRRSGTALRLLANIEAIPRRTELADRALDTRSPTRTHADVRSASSAYRNTYLVRV